MDTVGRRASVALVGRAQMPAYAAFVWSVVFIVPHAYWAAGGSAGLEDEPLEGTLAVINYAAIVLSVAAAALALALVRPWGASVPRRLLSLGGWGACLVLSLRGAAGVIQDVGNRSRRIRRRGANAHPHLRTALSCGGILFGLAAREYGRAQSGT